MVAHCIDDDTRGRPIVELLKPTAEDYFVLKPKQSGFYSTTLNLLLQHLGVRTLIMTGFTGDICVLFTAIDAHLRDYHLSIPQDCVASQDESEHEQVLKYMQRVLEADIKSSDKINFSAL
jgi:nicotinamidase-related amidase